MNTLKKLSSKRKAQKGFTLVEIAIVLVIIGLLLAGVLKGQEIINQAKIKNDVDSLLAFQAATYSYKDRMGYAPGTLRAGTPATTTLDKTQVVSATSSATTTNDGTTIGNYFNDLFIQQFIADPNAVPSWDEGATYTAVYGGIAATGAETNKNYICITYTGQADNEADVIAGMDAKLDDGNGATGKVRFAGSSICLEL